MPAACVRRERFKVFVTGCRGTNRGTRSEHHSYSTSRGSRRGFLSLTDPCRPSGPPRSRRRSRRGRRCAWSESKHGAANHRHRRQGDRDAVRSREISTLVRRRASTAANHRNLYVGNLAKLLKQIKCIFDLLVLMWHRCMCSPRRHALPTGMLTSFFSSKTLRAAAATLRFKRSSTRVAP